jgi:hypothetical protein
LHRHFTSQNRRVSNGDSGGPLLVDKGKTGCGAPGAFTELSGAQLAWWGQEVPAIRPNWGTCYTNAGHVGYPMARYVPYYLPTGLREGPYYWELSCNDGQPGEDPPLPPLCERRPWLCEEPVVGTGMGRTA